MSKDWKLYFSAKGFTIQKNSSDTLKFCNCMVLTQTGQINLYIKLLICSNDIFSSFRTGNQQVVWPIH